MGHKPANGNKGSDHYPKALDATDSQELWPLGFAHFEWHL